MFKDHSYKTLKVSIPIIIGELLQMSLHILDTAMVGKIGHKELAAVALVNSVINIPFVLGIGMTVSVAQMVSAVNGKADTAQITHYLFNGMILCFITALIIVLGLDLGRNILFYLNQDKEVAWFAYKYMHVLSWSLLPLILFIALKQFADGLEKTQTGMLFSVIALPVNFLINWLLINGHLGFPKLGFVGAAYGTLITRWLIFISLSLVLLFHKTFRVYISSNKIQLYINLKTIKQLMSIGIPASIQAGVEVFAFALSTIMMGMLGSVELAAHQIVMTCATFTFMASFGFAQGSSIRISNAWGRENFNDIWQIGKSALLIAFVFGIFCATLFYLYREYLSFLFNNTQQVVSLSVTLFLFAAFFQIISSIQIVSTSILRGVRDIKTPTKIIMISYWLIGLPLAYILSFRLKMNAIGIWIGLLTGLTFSALMLSLRFIKKNKIQANIS
jgi:MATE family multidrug resistance protein